MNAGSMSGIRRNVYMVLSPRSLAYARLALESLLRNSDEPLQLRLITDSGEDKQALIEMLKEMGIAARHGWEVAAEEELADHEATRFARFPLLREFRHGHPCWRKITDPLLLSEPGQELVLLDPDVVFPNRFRFEQTPANGLLLMWQRPNCLLPASVVTTALEAGIALARHVDIGVAHWREGADLEWLDWLLKALGGKDLPQVMHVEAIVWSALAMHSGGGYLDPELWVCWHRTQKNRMLRKFGASGLRILKDEPWRRLKCFHAGGEAKWWLAEAQAGGLFEAGPHRLEPGKVSPFVEMTPARYRREQAGKQMLRHLGYYKLLGAS